jgi:peptide/nickel transport system permease protein
MRDQEDSTPPLRGPWQEIRHRFAGNRSAMTGVIVLCLIGLFVLAGPWLWPPDPGQADPTLRNRPPGLAHPFGTDRLGRDILARLLAGGRISLLVGVAAMTLSLGLGTLIGVLAGYVRWLDGLLMRLTDMALALPLLPLLLVLVMLFREAVSRHFGPETGIFLLIVIGIGLTSWMQTARIVRGEVLALKHRDFITAARSIGTPPRRIITRHILPNVLSPILVSATLGIASAIITESALSFLGLGFPPDFPTWGRLLLDALDEIQLYPMHAILPGVAISLTVLSVNQIGEGLRDALDPRMPGQD